MAILTDLRKKCKRQSHACCRKKKAKGGEVPKVKATQAISTKTNKKMTCAKFQDERELIPEVL